MHIKVQTWTQPRHLTGDVSETGVVRVESFGLLGTPGDFSHSPMPWDRREVLWKHVNISPHLHRLQNVTNIAETGRNPTSMIFHDLPCILIPNIVPQVLQAIHYRGSPGFKGSQEGAGFTKDPDHSDCSPRRSNLASHEFQQLIPVWEDLHPKKG